MGDYPSIPDVSKIEDLDIRQALITIKQNIELLSGRTDVGTRAITEDDLITLGFAVRDAGGILDSVPTPSTNVPKKVRKGVQIAPQEFVVRQLVGAIGFAQWVESGYPDYSHSQIIASNTQDSGTALIVADNIIGNASFTLPDTIDPDVDVFFWIRNIVEQGYPGPLDTGVNEGTLWTLSTLYNPLDLGTFWDSVGGLLLTIASGLTPIPLDNSLITNSDISHFGNDAFVTIDVAGWYDVTGKITFDEAAPAAGYHEFGATLQLDTGGGFVDMPLSFSVAGGVDQVAATMPLFAHSFFNVGDKIQMALVVVTLLGTASTIANGSSMRIVRVGE